MKRTCVFFHAHPDDEALLTGGTMARLAAEGHRVVLVVATDGAGGARAKRDGAQKLGEIRARELGASARILGCARVAKLGYRDSGLDDAAPERLPADAPPDAFARAGIEEAAVRLARILTEEDADTLVTYDAAGGYGHPDHVRVHHVGHRAAELASTPVVLEATVDRDLMVRPARFLSRFFPVPANFMERLERGYSAGHEITHRVRLGRYLRHKRAAMAAHASQGTPRMLSRIPWPANLLLGTEWYIRR